MRATRGKEADGTFNLFENGTPLFAKNHQRLPRHTRTSLPSATKPAPDLAEQAGTKKPLPYRKRRTRTLRVPSTSGTSRPSRFPDWLREHSDWPASLRASVSQPWPPTNGARRRGEWRQTPARVLGPATWTPPPAEPWSSAMRAIMSGTRTSTARNHVHAARAKLSRLWVTHLAACAYLKLLDANCYIPNRSRPIMTPENYITRTAQQLRRPDCHLDRMPRTPTPRRPI